MHPARVRVAWAALLAPAVAGAHAGGDHAHPPRLAEAFSADPLLLVPLALAAVAYAAGAARLGRGLPAWRSAAFAGGMACLVLALVWPLDAYGEWSLAAHMAQHMVLMALAAPLLLVGLPGAVMLAGLPAGAARRVAAPFRGPRVRRGWALWTAPTAATLVQGAAMWAWHAPAAMERALHDEAVHYLMHASFLVAGLLFWWALLRSLRAGGAGYGAGLMAIVGTMVQMGLLSALLTFAPEPRYPFYFDRAPQLGLTALEDQQLAGLIMWVPAAVPYLVGGVLLMLAWLRRLERQERAASHDLHDA
ncbi:cytochrome c oxidase assembly protein [Coralloluteibacterium thermophilus]|uniref:Cytochrome c oxidase assembly protein n=1 Tax=Coralloluteibacterium thermophilum TaxID=2707049 RepID=A0ABV9NN91_9GAMM